MRSSRTARLKGRGKEAARKHIPLSLESKKRGKRCVNVLIGLRKASRKEVRDDRILFGSPKRVWERKMFTALYLASRHQESKGDIDNPVKREPMRGKKGATLPWLKRRRGRGIFYPPVGGIPMGKKRMDCQPLIPIFCAGTEKGMKIVLYYYYITTERETERKKPLTGPNTPKFPFQTCRKRRGH